MPALIRRYGFAAAVALALGVMALVVIVKSLLPDSHGGPPVGAAMAASKGGPPGAKMQGGGEAVMVQAVPVALHTFSDAIQALGTAQAKESIVITPKVSDVIRVIRFDSGDRVRRGQVLVELSNVEQQADLAEARAANVAAQEELRRFEALFERGFAPSARLDAVRAAADAANARLEAGQSRMADRRITAPFSGVMGLRTASPGQLVRPGDSIGTLDDLSEIKLDFDVPEARLAQLRGGVAIVARTAAFPNEDFTGHIAQVDSRVSAETRSVRVRALLPNRGERLRPGMLMTVEVRSNPREALAAPEPAIIDDAAGAYVFIAAIENGQSVAQRRPVRTGQRAGGFVEILEGLTEGDQVITEGVQRVRPDQPVRVGAGDAPQLRTREQRAAAAAQPG